MNTHYHDDRAGAVLDVTVGALCLILALALVLA